jgi:glycerol kinase
LATHLWSSRDTLAALWEPERRFTPQMDPPAAAELLARWHAAVHRSLRWAELT